MNEGTSEGADQQCPICWSLLCEPVAWPECAHHLCLVCALRTRRRPKPMCPLCRAPANQVRQAAELQVNSSRASTVRKAVGYSSYQAQRRDTWAQVADLDAAGGLGGPLALVAGRSEVWQRLRLGTQQEVLMEPKYEELLRWSRRSKGGCFAVVLQPADIEVGAKGRVCRIVENMESSPSERRVLVEAGAACRVIELNSKMQPAEEAMIDVDTANFVVGKLEELDEEELPARVSDMGPLAAAADIVHILGVLGRNLQAVRQRWMMTALVSLLDEDTRALENPQAEDRQGLESMLGVMMSYRQIIHQMDALLSQATATADRLIPAEREDEAHESLEAGELIPPTSSQATMAETAPERAEVPEGPQTPEPGQIVPLRSSSRREPVSQVEALRRRGDVLPVAGAANVAARSVSTNARRSSAPLRLRDSAGVRLQRRNEAQP